mmetsp:Transcript_49171/g.98965  ORF Transcript_49171/g.98965 Transcript_49171/m.98965 type:complete len:382 (+) Transcript_49171:66-1211(+)
MNTDLSTVSFRVLRTGLRVYSVRNVEDLGQSFVANFRIFFSWDEDADTDSESSTIEEWKPDFYFLNIMAEPFYVDGPLLQRKRNKKTGKVACSFQVRLIGKFSAAMNLRHFPFDMQELKIQLRIPRTDKQGVAGVGLDEGASGKGVRFDEDYAQMGDWETLGLSCEIVYESPGQPNFKPDVVARLVVARRYPYWLHSVMLPLSLIYCLLWYGFAIPRSQGIDRVRHVFTLFSVLLFFKFLVGHKIPHISYFTLFDSWIVLLFTVAAVTGIGLAVASELEKSGGGEGGSGGESWSSGAVSDLVVFLSCFGAWALGSAKLGWDAVHIVKARGRAVEAALSSGVLKPVPRRSFHGSLIKLTPASTPTVPEVAEVQLNTTAGSRV